MAWWRNKAYECPICGWQGMCEPSSPLKEATCPECGELMEMRGWMQTWGVTLLILGIVLGSVLFVGYLGS